MVVLGPLFYPPFPRLSVDCVRWPVTVVTVGTKTQQTYSQWCAQREEQQIHAWYILCPTGLPKALREIVWAEKEKSAQEQDTQDDGAGKVQPQKDDHKNTFACLVSLDHTYRHHYHDLKVHDVRISIIIVQKKQVAKLGKDENDEKLAIVPPQWLPGGNTEQVLWSWW